MGIINTPLFTDHVSSALRTGRFGTGHAPLVFDLLTAGRAYTKAPRTHPCTLSSPSSLDSCFLLFLHSFLLLYSFSMKFESKKTTPGTPPWLMLHFHDLLYNTHECFRSFRIWVLDNERLPNIT